MKAELRCRSGSSDDAPASFGVPMAPGEAWPGLAEVRLDGQLVEAQVDDLAHWDDGSIAHARVTLRGAFSALKSYQAEVRAGAPVPRSDLFHVNAKALADLVHARVEIVDGAGVLWVAETLPQHSIEILRLIAGSIDQGHMRRTIEFALPLRSIGDHPLLRARFRWTVWSRWSGAQCRVWVENCLVDRAPADAQFQSSKVTVSGAVVRTLSGGVHRHGTRWRATGWAGAPLPDVRHALDGRALAELRLCPDLDWSRSCDAAGATALYSALAKECSSSNKSRGSRMPFLSQESEDGASLQPFPLYAYQPGTGDRADIGWVPRWTAAMLNGGMQLAQDLQRWADVNGSGAFPVHFRANDDAPLGLSHGHKWWAGTRWWHGSPECVPDIAHHAQAGMMTWLADADEDAADEARCWAYLAVRDNYPNDGSLQAPGERRESWALRTIAAYARFGPDDRDPPAKAYFRDVLARTAAEWGGRVASMDSVHPLGQFGGNWRPSGRKWNPFTKIGSPWMWAWFTAQALAADFLTQSSGFRAVAEHAWRWFQMYASKPAGSWPTLDLDMLADYSVPTDFYEPMIDSSGNWAPKPNSTTPIAAGELPYAAWLTAEREKSSLGPADLPPVTDPRKQTLATPAGTDYKRSQFHEYGPGRCGTHCIAKREGLPSADAVAAALQPLIEATGDATKIPAYMRTTLA